MKTEIFFSSLAVSAGITLVELFMFFAYYRHKNQQFISNTMKTAAKETNNFIKSQATIKDHLPIEQIYAYSKYMDKIGKEEKEEVFESHIAVYVKTFMGLFVLVLGLLSTYLVVPKNTDTLEMTIAIIVGIICGSLLQFWFITNIIPMYKGSTSESLIYYTFNNIKDIVDVC